MRAETEGQGPGPGAVGRGKVIPQRKAGSYFKIIFLKELKLMDLPRSLLKTDRSFVIISSVYFLFKLSLHELFSWIKPVRLALTLGSHSRVPP